MADYRPKAEDDGWRIHDKLWERIRILLPASKPHPLGCHRPHTDICPHIRHRGEDAAAYRKPGQSAKRWVIERSNSWMNRFRRILIRREKKAENYVAMLEFAFAVIIFNKRKKENFLLG
jgi:transposase